jgi:hypothetical protein
VGREGAFTGRRGSGEEVVVPYFHGSRSCPSAGGHPETMKMRGWRRRAALWHVCALLARGAYMPTKTVGTYAPPAAIANSLCRRHARIH